MSDFVDVLADLVSGRTLPPGTDRWGVRTRFARFSYEWPEHGWAEPAGPILEHRHASPQRPGDGLCAAHSWAGMATANIAATGLLLVAYADADALSPLGQPTVRLRRAFVAEQLDGRKVLARRGLGADLRHANLARMDLSGITFFGADLSQANLRQAKLTGASLYGARLTGADLSGTVLVDADMRHAQMMNANLAAATVSRGTRLAGADLHATNINGCNITVATFR